MENKIKNFITSLSDKEIEEQLKDIFGWAKQYQELLEEEQYYRRNNATRTPWQPYNYLSSQEEEPICETFADEIVEEAAVFEYELIPLEMPENFFDAYGWEDDIKALSNEEIYQRYQNEDDWTVEYRFLCYKELQERSQEAGTLNIDTHIDDAPISLDYRVVQQIQDCISRLSLDETRSRLIKLQQIPEGKLNAEKRAELHFEIEACELHIYKLSGKEELICPHCGAEIEPNALFCGSCGTRVKKSN